MAVYLSEHDLLILHVPKCGGHYVEHAVQALGIPHRQVGKHWCPHTYRRTERVAAFVRHPLSWYESRWRYMEDRGWACTRAGFCPCRPVDRLGPATFNGWVGWVLDREPAYVTRLYEWYCGPEGNESVDFVGRQEHLRNDFAAMLEWAGCPVRLKDFDRENASRCPRPEWEESVRERVLKVEQAAVRRWYSGDAPLIFERTTRGLPRRTA